MKRTCIQCGKEFELSQNEIRFYRKKKLSLPKRCSECREKNRSSKTQSGQKKETDTGAVNCRKEADKTQVKAEERTEVKRIRAAGTPERTVTAVSENPGKKKRTTLAGLIAAVLLVLFGAVTGWNRISSPDTVRTEKSGTAVSQNLEFRSEQLLLEHYEKHGVEMGFDSAKEYEEAASRVASDSEALHKTEKEDGDDVYYLEETNEFVIVSKDGYLRTYFEPEDGIKYFERQ